MSNLANNTSSQQWMLEQLSTKFILSNIQMKNRHYERGVRWACNRKDGGLKTSSRNAYEKARLHAGTSPKDYMFWIGVAEAAGAFNGTNGHWTFFTPFEKEDRTKYREWTSIFGDDKNENDSIREHLYIKEYLYTLRSSQNENISWQDIILTPIYSRGPKWVKILDKPQVCKHEVSVKIRSS